MTRRRHIRAARNFEAEFHQRAQKIRQLAGLAYNAELRAAREKQERMLALASFVDMLAERAKREATRAARDKESVMDWKP